MPFCDLTKSITLPQSQKNLYRILRIIMIILFFGGISFFLYTLLFPRAHFSYNSAIDSLANTIKEPSTSDNITSFDTAVAGPYSRVKIAIDAQEDLTGKNILIRRSYGAFLAPITTDTLPLQPSPALIDDRYYLLENNALDPLISEAAAKSYTDNETVPELIDLSEATPLTDTVRGFASGSLLSSQSGIFVIDGTTKHAIDDETTFLALGYSFDDVIKADSEERGVHQKAKIYTIRATHPTNTFFETDDTNTFFHYDGSLLRSIDQADVTHTPISANFEDRNETVECILTPSPLSAHRFTCSVSVESISQNAGNIYRFSLPGTSAITKISTTLTASPTRTTIDQRISEMKKVLKEQFK